MDYRTFYFSGKRSKFLDLNLNKGVEVCHMDQERTEVQEEGHQQIKTKTNQMETAVKKETVGK